MVALALPTSASAATVFGADLTQDPLYTTSAFSIVTVIDPGGAANTGAPISGILTSVRLKTSGGGGSGVIKVLTLTDHADSSTYTFLNDGPEVPISVTPSVSPHVTEVLTRRPIAAGQKLAIEMDDAGGTIYEAYNDPTAECAYTSNHAVGTSIDYSTVGCNENPPLLSGTIEADADHDGYGDDTQDQCPTDATTQAPCPTTPTTPTTPPPHKKKCKKHKHRSAEVAKKKCKKKRR